MTNLVTNYNFLFIIVTILVTKNFLFFKLVFKLVTILTNNFWSLKLIINEIFSCSGHAQIQFYFSGIRNFVASNLDLTHVYFTCH